VAKAAEIVGLYMAPPDGAIVLAVDEKPSIQALERAQATSNCRRARHDRPVARLQTPRNDYAVRGARP